MAQGKTIGRLSRSNGQPAAKVEEVDGSSITRGSQPAEAICHQITVVGREISGVVGGRG